MNTSYPFNSSTFDSYHTSPSPINNMTDCYSRRTPPPLPSHCLETSGSAEHYLRQINSCENPPIKVVKPSTQKVCYKKEIRIRYLQPPTPPPPAPIIIREKRIPPKPPQSVINSFCFHQMSLIAHMFFFLTSFSSPYSSVSENLTLVHHHH